VAKESRESGKRIEEQQFGFGGVPRYKGNVIVVSGVPYTKKSTKEKQ
jgi:hypothetical protein